MRNAYTTRMGNISAAWGGMLSWAHHARGEDVVRVRKPSVLSLVLLPPRIVPGGIKRAAAAVVIVVVMAIVVLLVEAAVVGTGRASVEHLLVHRVTGDVDLHLRAGARFLDASPHGSRSRGALRTGPGPDGVVDARRGRHRDRVLPRRGRSGGRSLGCRGGLRRRRRRSTSRGRSGIYHRGP